MLRHFLQCAWSRPKTDSLQHLETNFHNICGIFHKSRFWGRHFLKFAIYTLYQHLACKTIGLLNDARYRMLPLGFERDPLIFERRIQSTREIVTTTLFFGLLYLDATSSVRLIRG